MAQWRSFKLLFTPRLPGCLQRQGERVDQRKKHLEAIFSFISLRITKKYFWRLRPDFSSNIFDYPLSRLQTIYFVFSDPPINFFQYCSFIPPHPTLSRKIMVRSLRYSSDMSNSLGGSFARIFFVEGKSHFFKILLFCYSNSLTSWHFSYFQRRENSGHKDRARGKVKYANIAFRNQFLEFLNKFSVTDSFGL